MDKEKVFPILRKFDIIWSNNPKLTFCELYKLVTENKKLTDAKLLKKLTEYITNNNIK